MLSYTHGTSIEPLLAETIGANLARTAARVPDSPAIVSCHQDACLTYAQFDAVADGLASGMLAAGLERATASASGAPTGSEWALVAVRDGEARGDPRQHQPRLPTNELKYALTRIGLPLATSQPRQFRDADFAAWSTQRHGPNCRQLERAIIFDSAEWDQLASAANRTQRRARPGWRDLDFDDPINIQYTSGTTGFPKGATLTHHNILNNGYFIGEVLSYTERDRICIPVPLYHCFGMVIGNLAATTHGACIVYPAEAFDPEATLRACATERCTSLYGVPTMFIAQLEHPSFAEHDLELAAHRHDGRLALPDRGDEARRSRHGDRARCRSRSG